MSKIKTIIFSKNRACQLDMLLRSISKYYTDCDYSVIYKYTNDNYKRGYDLIKDERFILESNFKLNLLNLIDNDYTCFLTDDCIFLNTFSESDSQFNHFMRAKAILCLSLRISPQITYSYMKNWKLEPQKTIWQWEDLKSYWGYPMSLDGHIFRTVELLPILKKLNYNNPNELEGRMALNPIDLPFMMCYNESRVINIPLNIVQTVWDNRHLGFNTEPINKHFCNGKRLDYIYPEKVYSCHQNIKLKWI